MQVVRDMKNAPRSNRETVSGKGRGAFLTTGRTTDGGVEHMENKALKSGGKKAKRSGNRYK